MRIKQIFLIFLIGLMVSACANSPMASSQTSKTVPIQQLDGTPLPSGAIIDSRNSIIFGEGQNWTGRVEADVSKKIDDTVKFFIDQYPAAGWTLLSSTKSQSSSLIFVSKSKTLTVEIHERSGLSSGSKVIMTVAPMNK